MRKAEDVEDPKTVVQEQAGQGALAKDDRLARVEEEHGIPQTEDKTKRKEACSDAVKTARDNVLEAKPATADKDGPVKRYR